MVHLSDDELEVIATYSINTDYIAFVQHLIRRKAIVLKLIVALQNLTAALFLRSRIGNGPLIDDISSLTVQITSNTLKVEYIAPLIKLVLTNAEDADIWTAVFDLVARTKPIPQTTTPPQSHPLFMSSFQQTPWSFNTGSFADASEHRKQVDYMLREELLPTLRIDIPDFISAVLGHIPRLDELAETVFDRCQEENTQLYTKGSGWTE
ncbi:MAG: hypothetical protein Q9178_007896 [Gyalolechia marmorata]